MGTVEIGMDYGIGSAGTARRPSESEAARLLHRALDLFILCSKVLSYHGQNLPPALLREKVTVSIHESLRMLATDVIDVMMIHSAPAEVIVAGDVAAILCEARQAGDIRWVGASVYGEETAGQALASGVYDCIQVAYSMLDRRPEARVIPGAARSKTGLVARSVLLKGALTERYLHLPESMAAIRECVERLQSLAVNHGIRLPELAYRYVLTHDLPQTALVGASSVQEVERAVQFAAHGPLSRDLVKAIQEISIGDERLLNPGNWPLG